MLTAIYMTRMMVMTFLGQRAFSRALPDEAHAGDPAHAEENAFADRRCGTTTRCTTVVARATHDLMTMTMTSIMLCRADFKPHESPWTMTVPLIVLAILSTVGGLVGIPYALSSLVGAGDVNVLNVLSNR